MKKLVKTIKQNFTHTQLLYLKHVLPLLVIPLFIFSLTLPELYVKKFSPQPMLSVKNTIGEVVPYTAQVKKISEESYDLKLETKNAVLNLNQLKTDPKNIPIIISSAPETEKRITTEIIFVDDAAKSIEFEKAELQLTETGQKKTNAILSCPTWDFDKETGNCRNWQISEIRPERDGKKVSFAVNHFSAYAGAYLEIINHQTNLTVGDTWELRFTTYGTADLQVQAVNGTVYGTDVRFIDFYCGETKLDTTVFDGTKVSIPSYSCDGQQSRLINRSVTPGPHYLEVRYGDQVDTAHNFACNVGTLDTTCEVSSSNTMTNGAVISGNGNLVIKGTGTLLNYNLETFSINMLGDVTIENGGRILGNVSNITAANLTINAGGSINADAKGYTQANGPGATGTVTNIPTAGAGYGGTGSSTDTTNSVGVGGAAYGSFTQPTDFGSGGGNSDGQIGYGGKGGGLVRLSITNTVTVNGTISANGGNGDVSSAHIAGSGSGGSVYITAATLVGNGSIKANGGAPASTSGGAGGGGRIALYYTTDSSTITVNAFGGSFATPNISAGAGTIYRKTPSQTYGELIIDNNNKDVTNFLYKHGETPITSNLNLDTLTVKNYGMIHLKNGITTNITSVNYATKGIIIDDSANLFQNTDVTVPATAYLAVNRTATYRSLQVDGVLTHHTNTSTQTNTMNITTTQNVTVSSTGSINVNSKGFSRTVYVSGNHSGNGTGAGSGSFSLSGSGGGHGGAGGTSASGITGGTTYGDSQNPTTLGSSGGTYNNTTANSGAGGGAINLTVGGTLSLQGPISANGGNGTSSGSYGGGAGSGGSIYISTNILSGSGAISANGGSATYGGGGGGGRLALFAFSNSYSGSYTVTGGTGANSAPSGRGSDGTSVVDLSSPALSLDICTNANNGCSDYSAGLTPQRSYRINEISGTVTSESQMNGITMSIKDTDASVNKWYNPATHAFDSETEVLITPSFDQSFPLVSGTVTFTYTSSAVPWMVDHLYDISVLTEKQVRTARSQKLFYFENSPPTLTNITASQNSSGVVTTHFDVTDAEASSTTVSLFADLDITLSAPVASTSATLSVVTASALPSTGTIFIDQERISYTGKSGTTLTGLTRGTANTQAVSHLSAATVWTLASQVTGDTGTVTNGTNKTITWTPADEYSGFYSTTARVLVEANDGQSSSMVGAANSSTFTLDTKSPTWTAQFIVDASTASPTLTIPCSDDTALEMKVGMLSNLSDASWRSYSSPVTASDLGLSSTDPLTYYAQCRDSKGNLSSIQNVTSPQTPLNIFYQDVSDVLTDEWREFIAWSSADEPTAGFKRYVIYRSVNGGSFSQLTTVANRLVNYIIDLDLDPENLYTYKVVTEDLNDNRSYYSNSISDIPDGTGGTDITPPSISNVASSNVTTTQATISWTTSKISDSKVYYKAANVYPGSNKASYTHSQGVPSMVTSNSVTLSDLTPDTTYYFVVESTDAFNNNGTGASASYTFHTAAGPVISRVSLLQVFDTEVTISWQTDIPADSSIAYSTNPDLSDPTMFVGSSEKVTNHRVTLTNLIGGTKYYYQVRSRDESSNLAIDNNVNDGSIFYYSFMTTLDTVPPVISNLAAILTGEKGVTIGWQTDELATSQLLWGVTNSLGQHTNQTNVYTIQHAVTITDLEPSSTYYYQVVSVDKAGNTTTSSPVESVQTAALTVIEKDTTPAVFSNINVSEITGTTAKVTWLTNKSTDSFVNFGTTSTTLDTTLGQTESVTTHAVTLQNLEANTTYYFTVTGRDTDGNLGTSTVTDFKTSSLLNQTESAEENAQNDELVSTVVSIVKDASKDFAEKIMAALTNNPNLKFLSEERVVTLISSLSEKALTAPVIDGTNVSIEPKAQSAVIKWETNKPANSMVAYATEKEYNPTAAEPYPIELGDSQNYVTSHEVELQGLLPNTTYHMQTRSKDSFGPVTMSEDSLFTTKALTAEITDISINTDTVDTVKITWKSSIPSRAKIEVRELESGESFSFSDPNYLKEHSFTSDKLSPGLNYIATLTAIDENGLSVTSSPIPFSTVNSGEPPHILEVKTLTSLIPGKVEKVQTIISWRTDKAANSEILYQLGGGAIPDDTKNIISDKMLTKEHLIVTSAFQPGQIYRYRIISTDFGGQKASSQDYTLLSPKPKENVVNLIINNVEDVFGFLKVN